MQRFYIDVIDGDVRHVDAIGEAAPFPQVRADAVLALLELFRQDLASLPHRKASAIVRDDAGTTVYTATLTLDASPA